MVYVLYIDRGKISIELINKLMLQEEVFDLCDEASIYLPEELDKEIVLGKENNAGGVSRI